MLLERLADPHVAIIPPDSAGYFNTRTSSLVETVTLARAQLGVRVDDVLRRDAREAEQEREDEAEPATELEDA